jgi:hypothetical protein
MSMVEEQQQITSERDSLLAQIDANPDWNEQAKERKRNEIREWAKGEIKSVREFYERQIEEEVSNSRRALYSVPEADGAGSAAERAQIYQSWRSARDGVLLATPNPMNALEGLGEILDEAERTGDTLLARAAVHRGLDLGLAPVVDRFFKDKPKEAQNLERYQRAVEQENELKSFEHLLGSALTERALESS